MTPVRDAQSPSNRDADGFDKRLDAVGWGLFLIMLGALWLLPKDRLPEGSWLIGTGLILLGLSAARYFRGVQIRGFTVLLGILALLIGLSDMFGAKLPFVPILLIMVGAGILLKPLFVGKW